MKAKQKKESTLVGIVGVGLDNEDGHQRMTRLDNFVLVGGSEETHERMTDVALNVNDRLKSRGKTLTETSVDELLEIFEYSKKG